MVPLLGTPLRPLLSTPPPRTPPRLLLLTDPGPLLVNTVLWVGSTMATLAVSSLHLRWQDSVGLKLLNIVKNRCIFNFHFWITSFQDGFLAEPKTEEQLNFLTSLAYVEEMATGVQGWWVGLADLGHEGEWVWQVSYLS